ncbi:MAG: hypothetical protein EAZ95_06650 [Bacteroidetes bacterium]|nr:MAG: hypothetical protein EAZ95_06650 [Bacteroidota bacterium]
METIVASTVFALITGVLGNFLTDGLKNKIKSKLSPKAKEIAEAIEQGKTETPENQQLLLQEAEVIAEDAELKPLLEEAVKTTEDQIQKGNFVIDNRGAIINIKNHFNGGTFIGGTF